MITQEDNLETLDERIGSIETETNLLNQEYGVKKKTIEDDKVKKSNAAHLKELADKARAV